MIIHYVSGSRADFGLMERCLRRLHEAPAHEIGIVATGQHVLDRYGRTVQDIRSAGLPVVAGTPLCAPAQDLDDTIDHVVQGRMVFYTKALHDRLEGQATTRN